MALTRPFLKGMGLTEEQVNAIVEAHADTIDALKSQRDQYKSQADKLEETQTELEKFKTGDNGWQDKYEKEHQDFEQYKVEVAQKETKSKLEVAYRKLLVDNGVGEKFIDSIIGVTDFTAMGFGEDGNIKDINNHTKTIKDKWAGFITSTHEAGADVDTPPTNGSGVMNKDTFNSMPLAERMEYANAHPAEVAGFYK